MAFSFWADRLPVARAYNYVHNVGGCQICGNAYYTNGCQITINHLTGCGAAAGAMQPVNGTAHGPVNGTISKVKSSSSRARSITTVGG